MPAPVKLNATYGKLTVLHVENIGGIRFAMVQCGCGKRKKVPVSRLTSGGAKSCGARGCRANYRGAITPPTRLQRRRAPAIGWAALRGLVRDYERARDTVDVIAARYAISRDAVYKYMRTVRGFGSQEAWRESVES